MNLHIVNYFDNDLDMCPKKDNIYHQQPEVVTSDVEGGKSVFIWER
jgi:hypothetical protein